MRTFALLILAAGIGCGEDAATTDAGADASANASDATPGTPDASGTDATPFVCDMNDPKAPPPSVLWAAPLSATGAETLGGHGHDDGFGPVGFCPGTPAAGQPFFELIAAGFETDEDLGIGALGVDFWRDPDTFTGVGFSGGRVNVYLEVIDEAGNAVDKSSAPEIVYLRELSNGTVDEIPIDDKPDNEFQTNFPMTGGGTRYNASVKGASDKVVNMRLPVNHHVTYVLVFQRHPPR